MDKIQQAGDILKKGGIVIFPTDTVYGVGCRLDNIKTVKRLNKILRRPATQPLPVLVDSVQMARRYLQSLPEIVVKLMRRYWPGGLTIVYFCRIKLIPSEVRGGGETLGIRMPDHYAPLQLIDRIRVPLVGTSANFHGLSTPTRIDDLDRSLIKMVNATVVGECKLRQASTVVDCTVRPWRILREGIVKL